MEPNDLKSNTPPDDARLEAWLRANTALPPLPDDSFSQAVLTKLSRPPARPAGQRRFAILLGAAVGTAVSIWPLGGIPDRIVLAEAVEPEVTHALTMLLTPGMGFALAVTAGSLLFVYWHQLRRLAPW